MLETSYQNFVYTARYARWREQEKRRETWDETVTRYCNFFKEHLKENYGFEDEALFKKIYNAIYDFYAKYASPDDCRTCIETGPHG